MGGHEFDVADRLSWNKGFGKRALGGCDECDVGSIGIGRSETVSREWLFCGLSPDVKTRGVKTAVVGDPDVLLPLGGCSSMIR
ncbi:hypothetical protein [Paraburkholderia dilworthii]|uniref:Uncharacterized protein n=1 Tax=Paraburkholderia dilworthii TaxID=948106 RepID=A0ABW9DIB1_9BURK